MRNTVILYFRMIFQMAVYLYTSSLIVSSLGVVDYGIYDVVGSIVIAFMFLNNSMLTCTQRFLSYALGANDNSQLRNNFSHSVFIHFLLGVCVLVLGGIVGSWYIRNYLVIPFESIPDAIFVLYASLVSAFILIVSVPYNAAIIAYEKMDAFAIITILDVLLKLAAVLLLTLFDDNRLRIYSFFLIAVAFVVRGVYGIYCHYALKDLYVEWKFDRNKLKEMFNFIGWNTIGNFAIVCNTQGLNLLLNTVGGPILNTARGIAVQVQAATTSFISSFQTAVNPQIIKSYAQGELDDMNSLVLRSSRISFMLMMFFVTPLIIETDALLDLWQKAEVPDYTVQFTRMLLCVSVIDTVANPLMVGAAATGRIKKYQLVIGGCMLCTLPLAYIAIKSGLSPVSVFIALLFTTLLAQIARMRLCKCLFGFSAKGFMCDVLLPIVKVCLLCFVPLFAIKHYLCIEGNLGIHVLLNCFFMEIWIVVVVFLFGLAKNERNFVLNKLHLKK